MDRTDREKLAAKRLRSVLGRAIVAPSRTLEQKISDAGPNNQRIDPHILNPVRQRLQSAGEIRVVQRGSMHWFHLASADSRHVEQKLVRLEEIHALNTSDNVRKRVGQALEIAIYRALLSQRELQFFGDFNGIDDSPDSRLYQKTEPPQILSGRSIPGYLDFLVMNSQGLVGGIEAKNVREWLYPHSSDIQEFLLKCTQLDVVPVLIARRIPFVTFKLLNACGVIVHETYRQRYPSVDTDLVEDLKDKSLFGYHDILQGNDPGPRLQKFIHSHLPKLIGSMRPTYDRFKDLLEEYGAGTINYKVFAAKVRRRTNGTNEDYDI